MQRVLLPTGEAIDFPDGMTPDQMAPVLASFGQAKAPMIDPASIGVPVDRLMSPQMPQGVAAPSGQLPYPGRTFKERKDAQLAEALARSRAMRQPSAPEPTPQQIQEQVLSESWYPSLEAGLSQAGLGFLSMGSRVIGGDADALNRESNMIGAAADRVAATDNIPDILQRGVRGVAASVPQSVVGGLPFGPAGAIGMAMAGEANQAITTGRDAGLSGGELASYVAMKGAIEGGVASVFQAAGLGGAEDVFLPAAKQVATQGVKQWLRQFAKETGAELAEENITEISHLITDQLVGENLTPDEIASTVADTTVQTLMTMGLFKAGGEAVNRLYPPDNQQTVQAPPPGPTQQQPNPLPPPVAEQTAVPGSTQEAPADPAPTPEPQIAEKPSPIEAPPPAEEPQGDELDQMTLDQLIEIKRRLGITESTPDRASIVSAIRTKLSSDATPQPAAEEVTDVAQDPGEEVIPSAIPEEEVFQGGTQGQVEPDSVPQQEPVVEPPQATEPPAQPKKRIGKKPEPVEPTPIEPAVEQAPPTQEQIDDLVAKIVDEEERADKYGTIDAPNRVGLGTHFAEQLASGKAYKSIDEARSEAGALLGGQVKPGSPIAKDIDEAVEIGVVQQARKIVRENDDAEVVFDQLVDLYQRQPRLGVRTSTSMQDQAYSTPAPLAWIASQLAGVTPNVSAYDSAAGNGMLLLGTDKGVANELNPDRAEALRGQGFRTINRDATNLSLKSPVRHVVINPPFGKVKEGGKPKTFRVGDFQTQEIDHAITMATLRQMTADGKATIIIGAKGFEQSEPRPDGARGRSYLGSKAFWDTLYDNYNVTDHFTVHGDLYSRQGASFPVDVIVVDGKRASSRPKPYNILGGGIPQVYRTWEELKRDKLTQVRGRTNVGDVGPSGEGGNVADAETVAGPTGGEVATDAAGAPTTEPVARVDQPVRQPAGGGRRRLGESGGVSGVPGTTGGERTAAGPDSSGGTSPDTGRRGVPAGPSDVRGEPEQRPGSVADKAAKARAEAKAANQEFLDALRAMKSKLTMGLDPDLARIAVKAVRANVKAGVYSFAEMVTNLAELAPDMMEAAAPYIESAWNIVRSKDTTGQMDEAGKVMDVLSPQTAPSENAETAFQVSYTPGSTLESMDTLMPRNHRAAVARALEAVKYKHGDLTAFVAKQLGFGKKRMVSAFKAEQADALALAIASHMEGRAFINGDQTGVGKGRTAAGMMEFARQQGLVPVFVTKSPSLYRDMMRDLADIGVSTEAKPFNPLVTNFMRAKKDWINLPDGRVISQTPAQGKKRMENAMRSALEDGKLISGKESFDAVFTTYDQLAPNKQQESDRHQFLREIAPRAFFIFDESHLAGEMPQGFLQQVFQLSTARMARELASKAAGSYFLSATFAKRPGLMDIYAKTGMDAATNGNMEQLVEAITAGGVPLQQVISEMLVESGMMMRRERSFDGVEFNSKVVDIDLRHADAVSGIFLAINRFDKVKEEAAAKIKDAITSSGGRRRNDSATGQRGVKSTTFSSILWNLVDQMLFGLKADAIADEAIASVNRGESPVIYVDATQEAALKRFVADNGISIGGDIDLSFSDMMQRYLDRSREILVQRDAADPESYEQVRLTDEDLGPVGVALFNEAQRLIDSLDFPIPASPIDHIRKRITDAGLSVAEATGRQTMIQYSDTGATYVNRPADESGTGGTIASVEKFNNGTLDVLIFNVCAATGVSMHASEKVKNQKVRHMIIGQPAKNIDTFMQSLGRVHRTGQVKLPKFSLMMTNAPAENRPAAVLVKKLASLNANVTASDKGAVGFDVPDVINDLGAQVIGEYLLDHDEMRAEIDARVRLNDAGQVEFTEDDARTVTGRVALLPAAQQQQFWDDVVAMFNDRVEELTQQGFNPLAADTADIKAKTEESFPIFDGDKESPNAFAQPAFIEKVTAVRTANPMTGEEVRTEVAETLGDVKPDKWYDSLMDEIRHEELAKFEAAKEGKTPEQIAKLRGTMSSQFMMARDALRNFTPGNAVRVTIGHEVVHGIVTAMTHNGRGSRMTLSRWKATIALAHPTRQVKLALSSLHRGDASSFGEAQSRHFAEFDEVDRSAEETRYIATGNVLAAMGILNDASGKVTFYTTSDGETKRGVLLPRSFSPQRWQDAQPVAFSNPDHVLSYLRGGGWLFTPDGVLSLTLVRDSLVLRAPKSKQRGGKYTLDRGITSAAGQDFVSIGARMELVVDDDAKHKKVINAVLALGGLQATEDKQRARDVTQAMMGTSKQRNLNLTTPEGGTQIAAADIIKTWSRLFKVPMKIGGFKVRAQRNTRIRGIYRYLEEVIRLSDEHAFDICVAAHEIAHHVDKMHGVTTDMLDDLARVDPALHKTVKAQLRSLDYSPSRGSIKEGFAELVRHYLTGDDQVAKEAMEWLTGTVLPSDKGLATAFAKALGHAQQYASQGFMQRARSAINHAPADLERESTVKEAVVTAVDRLYQKTSDRWWFAKKMSDAAQDKGAFTGDTATVYELMSAFDGTAHAHAAAALNNGIVTVSNNRRKISDSLVSVLQHLLPTEEDYSDAQAYAVARHTLAVPDQYDTGMSKDDAQAVVDYVQSDPDKFKRYDSFATGLTAFLNAQLEFLVDAGRITAEEKQRMIDAHGPTFVPLQRIVEDGPRRQGSGSRVALPAAIKRRSATGSKRPVRDLIEQTIERTQMFMRQALHQQVMESLVRAADPQLGGAEGLGEFVSRLEAKSMATVGNVNDILKQLVDSGWIEMDDAQAAKMAHRVRMGKSLTTGQVAWLGARYQIPNATEADVVPHLMGEPDVETMITMWHPDYRLPNGKYAIRVVIDGQPLLYELDPDFYESFAGSSPTQAGIFFEIMRKVSKPFKTGAVVLSTGFGLMNFMTDAMTGAINSKERKGLQRITKSLEWAARYVHAVTTGKPNEFVEAFQEYGGELFSTIGSERDDVRRFRQRAMRIPLLKRMKSAPTPRAAMAEFADVVESYVDRVGYMVSWSDVGPRLSEASARLERAGYYLKNGKFVDANGKPTTVPRDVMVKAMLAGADVTYNYRRSGSVVKSYIEPVLPFTTAAIQSLDKSIRTVKQILTESAGKSLRGKQARQMAISLAVITAADIALQMLLHSDDDEEQDEYMKYRYWTVGDGATTIARAAKSREYAFLANGISAMLGGGTEELVKAVKFEASERVPNGGGLLWTLSEVAANWSSYMGRPLEGQHLMDDPPVMRVNSRTLETSKFLGQVAHEIPIMDRLSPIEIEHILNGASGGAYNRWVGTGERAVRSVLRRKNEMTMKDIPFVRGAYVGRVQDASVDEFYGVKQNVIGEANYATARGDNEEFVANRREYERMVITENLMGILRKGKSDQYDPTTNIVALARESLRKKPLPSYPHPLYAQDLPPEVRSNMLRAIENEIATVAKKQDMPMKAEDRVQWDLAREASDAFLRAHASSPLVKEAIANILQSKSFKELRRGLGRPKSIGKEYPNSEALQEGRRRFDEKKAAAKAFAEEFAAP